MGESEVSGCQRYGPSSTGRSTKGERVTASLVCERASTIPRVQLHAVKHASQDTRLPKAGLTRVGVWTDRWASWSESWGRATSN